MSIDVTVSGLNTVVDVTMGTNLPITIDDREYVIIDDHQVYTGDYEVIPTSSVQTLATNDKVMTDDVTVREIPYYETSNVSGTTVYIGGL